MTVALGTFNISAAMSFVFYYSMFHPQVDMVYVLYTSIAIMTPVPLAVHYMIYKIKDRLVLMII